MGRGDLKWEEETFNENGRLLMRLGDLKWEWET